jgi:hypothetical protein
MVQLFHHLNTDRILQLPLECWKYDTNCYPTAPGATPATIGNQREQYIHPIGNRYMYGDSVGQILIGQKARNISWRVDSVTLKLVSINTSRHPTKKKIGKHFEWLLKYVKGLQKNSRIIFKNCKSPVSHVLTVDYSTIPLPGKSNLMRQ